MTLQNTKKLLLSFLGYKNKHVTFVAKTKVNPNKPRTLIICTFAPFGGLEMHALALYKTMLKHGYNAHIIIPQNSILEKKFKEDQISYYCYTQSKIFKPNRHPGLSQVVYEIIKKHNINIVHCNRAKDLHLLRKSKNLPIKIILTRHAPSQIRTKYIKHFDGIVGVNKEYTEKTQQFCTAKKLKTQTTNIVPFFKEEEILNFSTTDTKKEFFKKEFNLDLPNHPTLVMIAALVRVKNHQLMFKALHKLIYEKNKPINLILCGINKNKKKLKQLSKNLKIEKYIHFLGFTDKRIDVMYHSDIKILTSKSDANPIVLKEAALLKKPLIGPLGTGVINTIKHKETGLLFKYNDVNDLVSKIEKLIDNPNLQKEYGLNAYKYVKKNFVSDILIKKLEKFYEEI